jgi:uncharacterized protein YgfB (UPF0149 family)
MYGFDETGRVQSEDHREQCIDWIKNHCSVAADTNENPGEDHDQLNAMLEYLKTAPIG